MLNLIALLLWPGTNSGSPAPAADILLVGAVRSLAPAITARDLSPSITVRVME
jgi:hypothetical protein